MSGEDDDWFERALSGPEGDDGEAGQSGLFEEDFAAAFESADGPAAPDDGSYGPAAPGEGGDGPFGAGGGFGPNPEGEAFADAEFDSDIPRVDVGIDGLDEMIRGGVPARSLMTVIGSAGTGKTTFGLQFLEHGLAAGEQCVYIALEEGRDRLVKSAGEKGWPFEEYESTGQLAIVDIDPVEMANSLASIRNDLPRLVSSFEADRLVLDSVSLLELMYDDRARRRNEVYEFTRSLKDAGVTTLLTSEASENDPYSSRHGIVEYLTDAVFVMRYVRPSDFRETRLAIEIQKIRDANHSREMKPYEITDEGINVYRQANIF